MKKILVILTLVIGLIACHNQKITFPDFDFTSGYFPYQYPVRTLVLGDYIFDNTNDNNHKFLISAAIGGMYANNKDRSFDIQVDKSLATKALFTPSLDTIRMMPDNYYSLSSTQKLIVPKGEFNGSIEVQLTDAFFNDPLAIKLAYIIPVRLLNSSDVDTILKGRSSRTNPDSRVTAQWDVVPKDFTMFAVKFINPYHGKYLHRGTAVVKNASSTILETTSYHNVYIERDEVWSLVTTGKNQVSASGTLRSTLITGTLNMLLNFADNGTCTITQNTGSAFTITGTGQFAANADEWGNEKRNAIYINYQLTSAGNTYTATDTLVVRDRTIKMELFTVQVNP
jgi:hypothetical protein